MNLILMALAFGMPIAVEARAQQGSTIGPPSADVESAMLQLTPANTQPATAETSPSLPTAQEMETSRPGSAAKQADEPEQNWNFHAQNTDIVQGDPAFSARYSGPGSLNRRGEVQETVTADAFAGARLWPGAEAHIDGLMWQGFGLSSTHGIEAFPNDDAFKAGTKTPAGIIARLFVRETIGFGGEQEDVPDVQLNLAGKQDISRLTITAGRFSPTDICDNNTYAQNPHEQFMNWGAVTDLAWDYGEDTIGYTTGIALDFNQLNWALRYGFFQMPSEKNGYTGDDQILKWPYEGSADDGPFWRSWAMMLEGERRYSIRSHPGTIRFMAWLDEAHFASYTEATAILKADGPGADISAARAYRFKYGFGVNWEQEVLKNVGIFSRLGWNDGHEESWTFTDVNWTGSLGMSVTGDAWHRPDDTFGLVGIVSGASRENQKFLEAGGVDLTDGDGALSYRPEKVLETYYALQLSKNAQITWDYQFVDDPAFNHDRGPVSVFGARLHFEF
jgi:high affinity Mn2+ porin